MGMEKGGAALEVWEGGALWGEGGGDSTKLTPMPMPIPTVRGGGERAEGGDPTPLTPMTTPIPTPTVTGAKGGEGNRECKEKEEGEGKGEGEGNDEEMEMKGKRERGQRPSVAARVA